MSDHLDSAPAWFQWALKELGTREEPENRGAAIRRYIALGKCGKEGDPWCAIFSNAALEANSVRGTRSAASQSYRTDKNFVRLPGPSLGAIAVFWRKSKGSGLGHVGFYRGERNGSIWVLGGNEGDMVQIEALPRAGKTFGLIGYYWPKLQPVPDAIPVLMSDSAPTHEVKVT